MDFGNIPVLLRFYWGPPGVKLQTCVFLYYQTKNDKLHTKWNPMHKKGPKTHLQIVCDSFNNVMDSSLFHQDKERGK